MRLVNVEARSECAPQCDSRRFVDIAKLISPPRNHVATQRRGAHRSDPPPSRAFLRSTNPSLNPIAANRYPESGLCGSAAGLLEHRLQVRLRELQSIMVMVGFTHPTNGSQSCACAMASLAVSADRTQRQTATISVGDTLATKLPDPGFCTSGRLQGITSVLKFSGRGVR